MMILAFLFYRSPTMLHFAFVENGFYSICGISGIIIIFNYLNWYYDEQYNMWQRKLKNLKAEMQDDKMKILTQMDPLIVETLRQIVKKDMREEL